VFHLGVLAVGAMALPSAGPPTRPEAVFFDVGQGDAALLWGPSGEVILVDGGPDPVILRRALLGRGVRRIDLLVATHSHADHLAGLEGITDWAVVGRCWHSGQEGEAPEALLREMAAAGVPAEVPAPGWQAQVGTFHVDVLGPVRRYASPNDGSLVLRVTAAAAVVVLPGDVEAIAQADLGPLPADVLKVPHQGAATSDLRWLAASTAGVAVISVGPNDFGHPAPEVIAALEAAGAQVRRTDLEGDVVVALGGRTVGSQGIGARPSSRMISTAIRAALPTTSGHLSRWAPASSNLRKSAGSRRSKHRPNTPVCTSRQIVPPNSAVKRSARRLARSKVWKRAPSGSSKLERSLPRSWPNTMTAPA